MAEKRKGKMAVWRRAAQVASLGFFIVLLICATYPMRALPGLVDIYPRMSPLNMAAIWLNVWRFPVEFLPAVALLAATFVLGRFFCGWICPLGVTLDITDRALLGRAKVDDSREPFCAKWLKYGVLVAVLVAAYFEANLAGWLDPQSLVTRVYTQVFLPGAEYCVDLFLRGLRPIPLLGGLAVFVLSLLKTSVFALQQQVFHGMAATGLIFLAIALAAKLNRRFWCRYICPMGAMLALTSKISILRRVVDESKCVHCNKCVRGCRMGAIEKGGCAEYAGECVQCMTCRDICPVDAVSFRPGGKRPAPTSVNFTRRAIAASIGAGIIAVPELRLATGQPELAPIRPPGAGFDGGEAAERMFMQTCVRCGQCMRVCPTNGLQPAWLETGLEGMWAPRMVTSIGYCEFNCNLCGQVCPSGAIKLLTEEKKQLVRIGLASFDKNRCIPWSRQEECLVCEEHCPVPQKAIRFRERKSLDDNNKAVSLKLPYVVDSECIGCGICENKCPLRGRKGIHVHGTMPQAMKDAPAKTKKVALKGAAALLPDALAGWTAKDPASKYGKENLFEFIDGGAEVYYEYGYQSAATREYFNGEDSFSVDVFEMASPDASFGIFSNERSPESSLAEAGDIAWTGSGMLVFRQERFYTKITWYGQGDGLKMMTDAADEISKLVGKESGMPALLKNVPPDAPFETVKLVFGPLTMRGIFDIGEGDPAAFGSGARMVAWTGADGRPGGVIEYPSADAAAKVMKSLSEVAAKFGIEVKQSNPASNLIQLTGPAAPPAAQGYEY